MEMILLKQCDYLAPDGNFVKGDILIDGDKISGVGEIMGEPDDTYIIDLEGKKVIPGLIDIHFHGALGYDMMDAASAQIVEIARFLAEGGVTSFLPTTITSTMPDLYRVLMNIKDATSLNDYGASILGAHIEGPYINPKQKGCHDPALMKPPVIEEYREFKRILGDLKVHLTVAPELAGSMEFVKYVTDDGNTVSIGHSNADSGTVARGLDSGANVFTHLFNGMKGLHHREPGVAGAALVGDAFAEVICDGIHVHPEIVKLIYRMKGKERVVLVTDAMAATGLGDGEYFFGGFKIKVVDGIARKDDGTLASSTLSLFKAVKNMMQITGIPFAEAVAMASINPARVIGIDKITGSIEPGKRADLVLINDSLEVEAVICRGQRVQNSPVFKDFE